MAKKSSIARPGRTIGAAYGAAILTGTALLQLPVATASGQRAPLVDSFFVSTSAVCVTGLSPVDTATYWSAFGQAVILGLIQIGGLGIMTVAAVMSLLLIGRLGRRSSTIVQSETKLLSLADTRQVVRRIFRFSLIVEVVATCILTVRFVGDYGMSFGQALWTALFHAVSAFNNAGFSTNTTSLMPYQHDAVVLLTLCAAVIIGGLGFPVIFEIFREWRSPETWSIVTRVSVWITAILLVGGTVGFWATELHHGHVWGQEDASQQWLLSFTSSVMARTAGFNVVDIAQMSHSSWVLTDILMFIGAGSAGTAGGIKVTTLGVLAYAVLAEIRGSADVNIGIRRVPTATVRQALTIVVLAAMAVLIAVPILSFTVQASFAQVLFETISALSTTGLSTGITGLFTDEGKWILSGLMFVGRVGLLSLATGLAQRERSSSIRLPEERTQIG